LDRTSKTYIREVGVMACSSSDWKSKKFKMLGIAYVGNGGIFDRFSGTKGENPEPAGKTSISSKHIK
jgi:hypothetical protein